MAYDWYLIARERGFETPKQMLENLYVENGFSLTAIANEIGCSPWSVSFALEKFEIAKRKHGGTRRKAQRISPDAVDALLKKLEEQK